MTRINKLRKFMKKENIEAILISNFSNIYYYSKFSSEDALLLITKEDCYLLTDSRYTIQANKECNDFEVITITRSYSESLKNLLTDKNVVTLGFEENLE